MGASILILQGHPDPDGGHLCHALADAYERGARAGGHAVRRFDVAALAIPPLRCEADFEHGAIPEAVVEVQEALRTCTHLVVIFPLWLGAAPAVLKAVLEQVFRPGFAFVYKPRGFPEARLAGRSARVVVTMGTPAFLYRWLLGAHGVRALERDVLKLSGFSPVRRTLLGRVTGGPAERRAHWLRDLEDMGRRAG